MNLDTSISPYRVSLFFGKSEKELALYLTQHQSGPNIADADMQIAVAASMGLARVDLDHLGFQKKLYMTALEVTFLRTEQAKHDISTADRYRREFSLKNASMPVRTAGDAGNAASLH